MRNRYNAVDSLLANMQESKIVLTEDALLELECWLSRDLPASDPLEQIEQTARKSLEIKSLNGKPTRKWWQVSVTRKDTGYWESNQYCL
jgi:hypothetical protein